MEHTFGLSKAWSVSIRPSLVKLKLLGLKPYKIFYTWNLVGHFLRWCPSFSWAMKPYSSGMIYNLLLPHSVRIESMLKRVLKNITPKSITKLMYVQQEISRICITFCTLKFYMFLQFSILSMLLWDAIFLVCIRFLHLKKFKQFLVTLTIAKLFIYIAMNIKGEKLMVLI